MSVQQEYADFDIRIESDGDTLSARVIGSPAGSSAKVELPPIVEGVPMSELLLKLENAVLRAGEQHRRWHSPEGKVLQEFGRQAFDSVFRKAPDIGTKYEISLDQVKKDPAIKGLRLKFRLPPELSRLPWEYLYDHRSREHLCLRERTPLVRFVEDGEAPDELEVRGPLRVLGVVANPKDPWPTLNAARERQVIDKAVEKLQQEGRIEFRWTEADTEERLLDVMGREPWHVFHFIGHGGIHAAETPEDVSEGFIVLLDDQRRPVEVPASRLKYCLQRSEVLRLVVLNCCESARGHEGDPYANPAAALMLANIPAVVAMQYPIGDKAAICFAEHFYRALCESQSVERALTGARLHMHTQSDVEWGIPVLFSRSHTSRLFRVGEPGEAPASAPDQSQTPAAHDGHPARAGRDDECSTQELALAELRQLFNAASGATGADEQGRV